MPEIPGQRSLVFEFDSIQQRQMWHRHGLGASPPRADAKNLTEEFSGLLRVADVLAVEILVTDSQLLDGALFLHHGPVGVRKLMARSPAELPGIVVLGRDGNLAECLRKMLLGRDPDATTLAKFDSSTLSAIGEDAAKIAEVLPTRDKKRLADCDVADIATVVAAELQGALHGNSEVVEPTGVFAELARQWDAWFKAAEDKFFDVQPWSGAIFDMDWARTKRPVPDEIRLLSQDDAALNESLDVLKAHNGRSTVMAHLNDPAIPLSTRNVEQLWEWWNSLYFDAMAKQHGCSWLRLTADQAEAAVQESGGGGGHKPIQFEGELLGVLSAMPPTVYASARHASRKARDRWHRHASQEHSNGLAYAITKFNEPIDLVEARSSLIRQAALILGAAILGGLASIFISATAGWAAVVSLAVVVILATPIAEFRELHAMRGKKMKAFINYAGAHNA
ncbi:hypothetical protein [Specibacter sp. NPDC078709]|uniref:hypothetical protein n=1 Tax=Specibacter sp. NPDC078709 TaxID=3154364 RepID=UPI00341F280E